LSYFDLDYRISTLLRSVPTIERQLNPNRVPQRLRITIVIYVRSIIGKGYRHILNLNLVRRQDD